MKNVIDFILANYRLIADVVAIIIAVVFFIIKKRPNQILDTTCEAILKFLPHAINLAELSNFKGFEKKSYCINLLQEWAREHSLDLTDYYIEFAKRQIELILSTPQKKEVE